MADRTGEILSLCCMPTSRMQNANTCSHITGIWKQCSCMLAMRSGVASKSLPLGPQVAVTSPHLHFEMREFVTPFIGPGYREDTRGSLDPTAFIKAHRGAPEDDVGRALPAGSSAFPDDAN